MPNAVCEAQISCEKRTQMVLSDDISDLKPCERSSIGRSDVHTAGQQLCSVTCSFVGACRPQMPVAYVEQTTRLSKAILLGNF